MPKLVCSVCGKEAEVVSSADKLAGSPKSLRWMSLGFMHPGEHGIICGGGLFDEDGVEHDKCLMRLVMRDGEKNFRIFTARHLEVFLPVEGLLPEGVVAS